MSNAVEYPRYEYIAYIDEAGDPGIKRVRPIDDPGASEWLVIGVALIRREREHGPNIWVRKILKDIGIHQRPDLHFRNLSPTRRRRVCKLVSSLPMVGFALVSNKKNMRQYENRRAANKQVGQQWFYNWCCRLALERVTDFVYRDSMARFGEPKFVKIEYSERGGHNYSQSSAYYELLKYQAAAGATFKDKRVVRREVLHRNLMEPAPANGSPGCQIADIVASSFYTAVDNLETGPCNGSFAQMLRKRMAFERGPLGGCYISDYGVALQPTPDSRVNICEDQKETLRFYGYDFKDWESMVVGPGSRFVRRR